MKIKKIYHITLTDDDWVDLMACGVLHFTLDDVFCELKRGIE